MKNPNNGRVEVLMSFQKAPSAELFGAAPSVLRAASDVSFSWHLNHGECYINHLKDARIFTRHMQLTIARKAFKLAVEDIVSSETHCFPAPLKKLEGLIEVGDWRRDLLEWFISPQRSWFLGTWPPVWWPGPIDLLCDEHFHWNSHKRSLDEDGL